MDGAGQDLLRTAGICGGDTLWILSNVPDEKESSQSDRHSRTASASKALQPPQHFSQAAEQPSSQAAEQQTTQQVSASSQKMQEAHKVDMQQLEQARPVSVVSFDWDKTNRHMTFILICSQSHSSCRLSRRPTSPSPVHQTCCSEFWTAAQQFYRVGISCCY